MIDIQTASTHSRIQDRISDYADIRHELEDALNSIRILYGDMELSMEDLADELDVIEKHLSAADRAGEHFRVTDDIPQPESDKEEELPWN